MKPLLPLKVYPDLEPGPPWPCQVRQKKNVGSCWCVKCRNIEHIFRYCTCLSKTHTPRCLCTFIYIHTHLNIMYLKKTSRSKHCEATWFLWWAMAKACVKSINRPLYQSVNLSNKEFNTQPIMQPINAFIQLINQPISHLMVNPSGPLINLAGL